jgi:hypothetical protein
VPGFWPPRCAFGPARRGRGEAAALPALPAPGVVSWLARGIIGVGLGIGQSAHRLGAGPIAGLLTALLAGLCLRGLSVGPPGGGGVLGVAVAGC